MDTAKILVVDDEPDIELLIRQKFAKQLKSKEIDKKTNAIQKLGYVSV